MTAKLDRNAAPSDLAGPIPGAWLDRAETYGGWDAAARIGRRLLAPGVGLTVLRAEAERRGYTVVSPGDLEAGGTAVDLCVIGRAIADAANPVDALRVAWTQVKPGGVMLVFAPPPEPRAANPPAFGFDRATLESALVRAGFEHIRIGADRDR